MAGEGQWKERGGGGRGGGDGRGQWKERGGGGSGAVERALSCSMTNVHMLGG